MATKIDKEACREAYNLVRDDATEVNWVTFKYNGSTIVPGDQGVDYETFKRKCTDDVRLFGFVRFTTGDAMSKRVKFALITWIGEDVSGLQRAKTGTDKTLVKEVVQNFAKEFVISDHKELDEDYIKNELKKAGGANYDAQTDGLLFSILSHETFLSGALFFFFPLFFTHNSVRVLAPVEFRFGSALVLFSPVFVEACHCVLLHVCVFYLGSTWSLREEIAMLCAASLSLPLKDKIHHDPKVSQHSKLRGLEMSGHLVTILCTLVSGFVSDFPNAGAQELSGAFGSEHPPAGTKGWSRAAPSLLGLNTQQREPGLSLVPNCFFVGASLYGFCFPSKVNCPQNYMLGETVGLGSQRYKSITEINVFQEQFSATLLFFYPPCNKPIFRRFLNPCCKALSSCNLGAIRRIKHWLNCKMIPVLQPLSAHLCSERQR
ncbi:hypothetical protein IHE44_0002460 [Lamprotornis superbus]|uniref:Coactosin-like protein n=1 Tax=Lamprotornis superbus TaxID=245042 RepID=A0A835NM94_9PASS|nr:hypothetical protein IHE44_0002460 [Lamprotornis superbus]